MIKSKKQMYIVIGAFALVLTLVSTTYAFFNYTRTGSANVIKTGRIYFNSEQGTAINLTNMFPIDVTNGIPNDNTKVGTITLNVTGDTTYDEGIEYLVSAVNVQNTVGSGASAKSLPISIDVSVTNNTTNDPATTLGTSDDGYFVNRGGNSSIYNVLAKDTISNNDQLLVGYITKGSTGVDGNIVIKAYLDKAKIAITDTYDGNETDNMGTTRDWVDGRVTFTTEEWNSLQQNGVSFQLRVESNEGIWVENINELYTIMKRGSVLDNAPSEYVSSENGIDFSASPSDTNGKGLYMISGTESDTYPVVYYRGNITDNNVYFANKCWKAVRTTDTGGVKLIYNGENNGTNDNPICNNSGTNSQITLAIDNTNKNNFKFGDSLTNIAYVGYMYGDVYEQTVLTSDLTSNKYVKYGSGFTWNGTKYILESPTYQLSNDSHYFCITDQPGDNECETINFTFYSARNEFFISMTGGDGIDEALAKMQTNTHDSIAKEMIDTWYEENMMTYTNKLEDTIWCNDRSMDNISGWRPNGDVGRWTRFGAYMRIVDSNSPSIQCINKNDAFTVDSSKGNGKLTYPVALLTWDEVVMSGISQSDYLVSGSKYWLLSPSQTAEDFSHAVAVGVTYLDNGFLRTGMMARPGVEAGLRPSVSLKSGATVLKGTGVPNDPYVIK